MTRVPPIFPALALAGVIFLSLATGPALRSTLREGGAFSDFLSFYSGSKLLAACELYSYDKTLELQRQLGMTDATPMVYIRLPFYAALLSPLAKLDYRTAYLIFQLGSLASFAWAMLLWRRFGSGTSLVLFGSSAAMAIALLRGQDAALVLLFASISARLLQKGRHFSAGAVLALGLIKWHLLWAIPILALARRLVRFGAGFATVAALLLAWSFALCVDWPLEYWRALQQSETTLRLSEMPNLRALLNGVPGENALLALGIAVGIAGCWRAFRSHRDLDEALAICLLAGVILSPHSYSYDCVLILPAAAVALSPLASRPGWQALGALGLAMCPALLAFPLWRFAPQLALFALMAWLCARPRKS